ncbi:hypothetical protein [Staphylococcus aureus]|uniref:hypothetical protein n=1 Tax=Staphylococcus aureus TaxID=1280 RepID=UPI000DE5607B|nr:hypothetical protein [Staphylococcus aureus]
MKQKMIIFIIASVLIVCSVFVGYQISRHQVKVKEQEIESMRHDNKSLKSTNAELNELVRRQSKTVIADEEKQIRETSEKFVLTMFEMKKETSFKGKSGQLKSLVTDDYYDKLFQNTKDKYNLYDDITVDDVHVYFDTYDPKQESYKVFVQFDERIVPDGDEKIEHRQTSAQLDLVRTGKGWKVDALRRFNLKPLGR